MSIAKLGLFLTEVANWKWDEFVKAEHDTSFTSNEAMIFALVRACAMQKIDAIRLSLNRLDGKLKTPVKIEYPKIFYIYPNATLEAPADTLTKAENVNTSAEHINPTTITLVPKPEDVIEALAPLQDEPIESDLPSLSLRQTLTKMSDYPRETPQFVVEYALQTEQWLRNQAERPEEIPAVKSVIAAHLLIMAANRKIDALTEVFDQIDGKLAETIQILGDDIYITSYITEAPPGAYLNADGVVEFEAKATQDMWTRKLGGTIL